jgi:hypothetical protein
MTHTKRAEARVRNAALTARAIAAPDVALTAIALIATRADRRAMARNMCARGSRAHKRAYRALCRARTGSMGYAASAAIRAAHRRA